MASEYQSAERSRSEGRREERNEYGRPVATSAKPSGKPGGRSLTSRLSTRSTSNTPPDDEASNAGTDAWWREAENPRYFLDTFSYYVASSESGAEPERQEQGAQAMDETLDGVRDLGLSLNKDPDAGATAFGKWDTLRPQVHAVLARYKAAPEHDDASATRADEYFKRLDARIVARRMKIETDAGIADVEMASPEDGFYAVEAGLLAKAIDGVIGTKGIYDKLAKSLIAEGREDAVAQLKSGAAAGMSALSVYNDFVKAGELSAQLKKAHAAGKLKEAATVGDFLRLAFELCKDVCQTIFRIAEVVARPSMPDAAKAVAELSYSLDKVAFVRVLTGAIAVVQIIVAAVNLFDAIQRGSTQGIVSATHDILQGTWTLAAVILNIPTAVIIGVGATLYLWYQGVLMFGQLGGILGSIKDQSVLAAVQHLVELGANVANDGLTMASAWQRFLDAGAKDSPSELQEQLVQAFKTEADSKLKKVLDGLGNIRSEVDSSDQRTVGGHTDLAAEFGNDARAAAGTGTLDPMTAAEQCNAVFLGIDRVAQHARKRYGA